MVRIMKQFRANQSRFGQNKARLGQSKCGLANLQPRHSGPPEKRKAFWEEGTAIRTVKPFSNENGEPIGFAVTLGGDVGI